MDSHPEDEGDLLGVGPWLQGGEGNLLKGFIVVKDHPLKTDFDHLIIFY